MISALAGSTGAQLLSMFARPQAKSPDPAQAAQRPPPPPPGPPPGGNGASAQSIFEALITGAATQTHPDQTNPDQTAANPLEGLLSGLLKALDTNGDGTLSADELKSAAASLQGGRADTATATFDTGAMGTTATATASHATATGGAKSLYESLFNAMAGMTGQKDSASQLNDLSQKFLTTLVT